MTLKPSDRQIRKGLYIPATMNDEITEQAKRLERSVSWLMRYAWERTRDEIVQLPVQSREGAAIL